MHIDMVIKRTLILDIGEWPLSTSYCLHLFITSVKILVNSCHWGAKWTSFFYFIAAGSVSFYLKEYGIFATTLQLLTTKLMSELHISDSLSFWYVLLSLSFIFPGAWKPMAGPYHGAHVCHPLKFNPCITTAIVLISARKGKQLSAKRTITVTFAMTA